MGFMPMSAKGPGRVKTEGTEVDGPAARLVVAFIGFVEMEAAR